MVGIVLQLLLLLLLEAASGHPPPLRLLLLLLLLLLLRLPGMRSDQQWAIAVLEVVDRREWVVLGAAG